MRLWVLDGYSLMYRAYHAFADSGMSAPDGTPTGAVHGFIMMLGKLLKEESPERICVAFDAHAKTFRHELSEAYKATRSPMPDDMRAQDPVIRELLALMGIRMLELPGFEADDLMGTLSLMCEESENDCTLVTGDRDSFQLAGKHTGILYTRKGLSDTVTVDPDWIRNTYGLEPQQLIDVKALMGDHSDNISGITGIGEKTALRLITQYGDLEQVLLQADTNEKGKLRERLLNGAEDARLSLKLARIDRHVPLGVAPEELIPGDPGAAIPRLRELGMNQAARLFGDIRLGTDKTPETAEELPELSVTVCEDTASFRSACSALAKGTDRIAISLNDVQCSVCSGKGCFSLPLGAGDLLTPGITREEATEALDPLTQSEVTLITCALTLREPLEDIALMAYCVDPQRKSFTDADLSVQEGLGALYSVCPAAAVGRLYDLYTERLASTEMTRIYREIELPLAHVLRSMELEGALVDAERLRSLGQSFRERIAQLKEEIAQLAGETVNLNSPKQLGALLFDRLGIPAPKKTAKGYSTDAEVLEQLLDRYPICARILEYRKYAKLESTYIDVLLRLRDPQGRVHTSYDQTATATGRISSLEPNLQNIPVRTELGKQIRSAFVPRPGWVFVDADYSQIELRVLAHISNDEAMIASFLSGEDIHRRTAAEVRGIPLNEVTPEMRSAAKAVNFGIVYGISDFSLAKNLGISRNEAKDYIRRYFERYPGVQNYLTKAVEDARTRGWSETLFGRRRYLPELNSPNFNIRSFGERCAMNSPIQGTAADIIKTAMIRTDLALKKEGLRARLILQVHDELTVEAPENEVDAVCRILTECMEHAAELRVPLKTDLSTGRNWSECK